jgi:hypothetical protein
MSVPELTHVASRLTLAAGTLPNGRGHLAGWIANSQSIKPGNRMPPNALDQRISRRCSPTSGACDERAMVVERRATITTADEAAAAPSAVRTHGTVPRGIIGWFSVADHKTIGRRYIITAFASLSSRGCSPR